MEWFFPTRLWRRMHGHDDRERHRQRNGRAGLVGIGAWILRRDMFAPIRGPWPNNSWKGSWGDEPPYQSPCSC